MPGKHKPRRCKALRRYGSAAEAAAHLAPAAELPVFRCQVCDGFHIGKGTHIALPLVSPHAIYRLMERHGVQAPLSEWLEAHTSIEEGRASKLRRSPDCMGQVWDVALGGMRVPVVFDPMARLIVTVLPPSSPVLQQPR